MSGEPAPQFRPLHDDVAALRPVEESDLPTTVAWRNDPAIRDQVLSFRFPVTHAMEAQFIERAVHGSGTAQCVAGIVDRSDNALCGLVYLRDIDWISRNACFGMMIGRRDKKGKGLGRSALNLMLHHAFNVLNLERVYLYVVEYNKPARRLYETAGFSYEGALRQHVALEGRTYDLLPMGLLRSEFKNTTNIASAQ